MFQCFLVQVGIAGVRTHQHSYDTKSCYHRSDFEVRGWARCVPQSQHSGGWGKQDHRAQASLGCTVGTLFFFFLNQGSKQTKNKTPKSRREWDSQGLPGSLTGHHSVDSTSPGEGTATQLPNETDNIVTLPTISPRKKFNKQKMQNQETSFRFLLVGPTSLVLKKDCKL